MLIERLVFPYLSALPVFQNIGFLRSETPVIINRREEIRINEGINYIEVANRTKSSLVSIYIHEREFGSQRFKLDTTLTGIIVSSDGLIVAPLPRLKLGQSVSILTSDDRLTTANVLSTDQRTGLSLIKVEATNLSVVRQGFSRDIQLGDRLIVVSGKSQPLQSLIKSVQVLQEPGQIPSLEKTYELGKISDFISVDSLPDDSYLGGAVMNKDSVLVGVISKIGSEIVLLRSEDFKMLLDNYFDDQIIIWPQLSLSYNVVDGTLSIALGGHSKYGIIVRQGVQGLQSEDFIYKIDGQDLNSENGFDRAIMAKKPGTKIELELIRDGEVVKVVVNL